MAINEDTRHENRNTLYLAKSGSGKSQALGQNKAIPARGGRVLLYDPNNDHKAHRFDKFSDYCKAVAAALRSKKPFRLAYTGGIGVEDFERWCRVVWLALDGNKITIVIAEELSAVCPSAAKASPMAAKLLNQGRKYGMQFHGTSQKPQEVAKTFYDGCEVFYVGRQRGNTATKLERDFGLAKGALAECEPLTFYLIDDAKQRAGPEIIKFKYKNIK